MRLRCRHPNWQKIARTTAIIREHPESMGPLWLTGRRTDHAWTQKLALLTTCKKWGVWTLLKTKSFRQFHIAHKNADTPMRIYVLVRFSTPSSQLPNIFGILLGGEILYVKWIKRHIFFVDSHDKNKCSIDSSLSQKNTLFTPYPMSLNKIIFG